MSIFSTNHVPGVYVLRWCPILWFFICIVSILWHKSKDLRFLFATFEEIFAGTNLFEIRSSILDIYFEEIFGGNTYLFHAKSKFLFKFVWDMICSEYTSEKQKSIVSLFMNISSY